MVDLTSFWSIAWQSREQIPASFAMMLIGLAITGVYYFSASMVFPERPEEWPDFDEWTRLHKRQVMGGILLCNLIATALVLAPRPEVWSLRVLATNMVLLGLKVGFREAEGSSELGRRRRRCGAELHSTPHQAPPGQAQSCVASPITPACASA
jgi:hypothetical protein